MKCEFRQTLRVGVRSAKNLRHNSVKKNVPLKFIKFEEANLDWLRFWSQLEMQRDQAEIATMRKFHIKRT